MWIRTFENNEETLLNITNISKITKRNNHVKTLGSDISRVEYQILIFSEDSNGSERITTICFLTERDRDSGFDIIRRSKEVMGGLSRDVDLTGSGAYSEEEWE
ncbi:hypothetical protein [Allisonella histaminiformans]|uniref:hypothetical protein n=1 Tax=Allisonella histaminiformans TaxID=209880 RepID=UPI002E791926|nr:hypothetical protein [Allisonella histaminiformans]